MGAGRIDTGSRVIAASPEVLYWAHLTPASVAKWRPPQGMTGEVMLFEPKAGGRFRMAFRYKHGGGHGKTSSDSDVFQGEFVELVPGARIVERVRFEAPDGTPRAPMTLTTTFTPVSGRTRVDVRIEGAPDSISAEDHAEGIRSSLENLARFTEPY